MFSLIPFFADLVNTAPERFTRDPVISLDASPLIGFFSNVGIFFWCGTFFITLFTSVLIRKINKPESRFLLVSALITLLLLADDWFLLHDYILPGFFGVTEKMFYLAYVIIIILYLSVFYKQILELRFTSLALAFLFFAISMVSDIVMAQEDLNYVVEDGFKLAGIVTWFLFFSHASMRLLQKKQRVKLKINF